MSRCPVTDVLLLKPLDDCTNNGLVDRRAMSSVRKAMKDNGLLLGSEHSVMRLQLRQGRGE
jgi:hypothetical protein